MPISSWPVRACFALCITCLCFGAASAAAQEFDLTWSSLSPGSGELGGGEFSLTATLGAADAGAMSGGVYALSGGFIASPPPCVGDVNDDRAVNLTDLSLLLSDFGVSQGLATEGDLNGDGRVDLTDLALLLANFGVTCD